MLAFNHPTYRIHECWGQIDARLLAWNLPVTNAPSFNCQYDICEVSPLVQSPFLPYGPFRDEAQTPFLFLGRDKSASRI